MGGDSGCGLSSIMTGIARGGGVSEHRSGGTVVCRGY